MAITFGNTTYDVSGSSFSHNNNGDFLIVFSNSQTSGLSTVTYNSVGMTKVGTTQYHTAFNRYFDVWILVAPTSGSNTVAWTGGGAGPYFGCVSVSGVDQTTPYTGLNTAAGTGANPTLSITTTVDNAYPFSAGPFQNTASAGANTTLILNVVGANVFSFRSTNAKTPAGAFTLNHTMSSGEYAIKGFGINPPATGPANLKSLDTNVKANIKSYNTNVIANIKSINTNV